MKYYIKNYDDEITEVSLKQIKDFLHVPGLEQKAKRQLETLKQCGKYSFNFPDTRTYYTEEGLKSEG